MLCLEQKTKIPSIRSQYESPWLSVPQLRQSGGAPSELLPAPSVLPPLYSGGLPSAAAYSQYPPYGQYSTESPPTELSQQARTAHSSRL